MVSSGYDRCERECTHDLARALTLWEMTAPMSMMNVIDCAWCDGTGKIPVAAPVPCMKCFGTGKREVFKDGCSEAPTAA